MKILGLRSTFHCTTSK